VLDAIDVVQPRILVAEYNSLFGPDAAVTVPYESGFRRAEAHWSHLYWGASLKALTLAAERKGLALVGSNSAGNNAFFVRKADVSSLPTAAPSDAWVDARFRESRGPRGDLSYLSDRRSKLSTLVGRPLVDVATGAETDASSLLTF
jgi:hypothetical protein